MAKKSKTRTAKDEAEHAATSADSKLTPQVLEKALADLEAGAAGIKEMGIALGYKSGSPLRAALRAAYGDAAYQRAIDAGRSARGVTAIGAKGKPKAAKKSPSKKRAAKGAKKS